MSRNNSLSIVTAITLSALVGCGAGRTVQNLQVSKSAALNPADQVDVVVRSVVDARSFETHPRSSRTPSLKNPQDVDNPTLTARAFGRKRGSFGKARGDFLLPEGRTVSLVVREVVEKALRQRGYRVLSPTDPGAKQAVQLRVRVEELWSYFRPGAFQVAVDFVARVRLDGAALGSRSPLIIESTEQLRKGAVTDARWVGLVERGLRTMGRQIRDRLPDPMETIGPDAATAASAPEPPPPTAGP